MLFIRKSFSNFEKFTIRQSVTFAARFFALKYAVPFCYHQIKYKKVTASLAKKD